MDTNTLKSIIAEATAAAATAAQEYVDNWTATTGGNQYGEPMYCGFAWVNIFEHDGKAITGNTKIGRALKAAGVRQDYSRAFQIWDPAGWHGQSMDVKVAGAEAAARVLEVHGFAARMGYRAD
jgi:hypothetical protein